MHGADQGEGVGWEIFWISTPELSHVFFPGKLACNVHPPYKLSLNRQTNIHKHTLIVLIVVAN